MLAPARVNAAWPGRNENREGGAKAGGRFYFPVFSGDQNVCRAEEGRPQPPVYRCYGKRLVGNDGCCNAEAVSRPGALFLGRGREQQRIAFVSTSIRRVGCFGSRYILRSSPK
jgi:hypothetical protein